ncbi:signal transduction histidine kinase [Mycolicibacterium sp. 624]
MPGWIPGSPWMGASGSEDESASAPQPLSRPLRPTSPPLLLGVVVAALLIAAECALVSQLERVGPGNIFGVVFLLGVLFIAILWGFALAMAMALASALIYVHFHHMTTGRTVTAIWEQNWVAITVFLVVAAAAAGLASLARSRAAEAVQRRRQVEASHAKLSELADELSALAEQQAALRRIATLVARGVSPTEVFSAVALELAEAHDVPNAAVWRYEPHGAATLLAAWDTPGATPMPVGEQFPLEGDNVAARVRRTGRPARMDNHDGAAGPAAAKIRELGLRGGVGAPIVVDGRLWGVAVVGSPRSEPLPPDTEGRVGDFADLVATAIANAQTNTELAASRVRIVAAADDARRRIERDLHDGAQQRLVSLGLELRTAEACVPPELQSLREQIAHLVTIVAGVSKDLQDLSRGIHPAILSKGGLGPALKTLARRSAVPVELDLTVKRRLPESAEVTAYYVVAEALTNAAKHAQASVVKVGVDTGPVSLHLSIQDDGVGGADTGKGSGLTGLTDRVEAIGGQMTIRSHPGSGTSLLVEIPC